MKELVWRHQLNLVKLCMLLLEEGHIVWLLIQKPQEGRSYKMKGTKTRVRAA